MFLFTTPPATPSPAASTPTGPSTPVTDAIRKGAAATGTDFDYLLRTAKRESALDPAAKAPTSSATGLFQFIEQTWLGVVKNDGPSLGLADQADAIVARSDGSYAVPDSGARQAILKLREQPEAASAMAGALTRRNRETLVSATGREPSRGELYLAHVLGARGASQLINAASKSPDAAASDGFPEAARANRSIFYAKGGAARSNAEVYALLTAEKASGGAGSATSTQAPVAAKDLRPPGLYGLFQTGARQGPVSDAVARIWKGQSGAPASRTAAASFFPRSTEALRSDVATTSAVAEPSAPAATAPLPGSLPPSPAARPDPAIRAGRPAGVASSQAPAKVSRP
jgi:hypothetical protein